MKYVDAAITAEKISHELNVPMHELVDIFAEIPAADVQPIKQGLWEEITDYGGWGDTHYRCSVCGEDWYLVDGTPKQNNMNFCPKCGARMDLKDGDTE